jgi:hypothetical protein
VRKLIASVLAVALVCGLSISLVGCGGNKATTTKTTSGGGGGTTQSTSTAH